MGGPRAGNSHASPATGGLGPGAVGSPGKPERPAEAGSLISGPRSVQGAAGTLGTEWVTGVPPSPCLSQTFLTFLILFFKCCIGLSLIYSVVLGGGHGNPLQCSCLENPRTEVPGRLQSRGLQSQTRLKRLSTQAHS